VVAPIIDFLASVARGGKAKDWYSAERVGALVEAVFAWAQISTESVSTN
jgi:importin-9